MKNKRVILFSPPDITDREIKLVTDALRSGWITTGPRTKLFEQKIAAYCGTSQAVCLNSATAAMEMTLRVLGVGAGDEVITSAYTYTASASVIHHVGAKIVLVDTAENSYEMDYEKLSEAITENTKVIIPVDIAGVMCDYDKIFEIVQTKKNIFKASNDTQAKFGQVVVMADAAHSFGAIRHGRISGNIADFTCFSFHAVKNLTTAEGGAVTWRDVEEINNDDLYREYQLLSLHGQSKDALAKTKLGAWEYDIVYPAYKCNMTDICAAIGISQIERYQEILEGRKDIVEQYDKELQGCNLDILKHYGECYSGSAHLYLVRFLEKDVEYRNSIIVQMAEAGIATNVHYKPLPMHTAYKKIGFDIKNYPNAYHMYHNEITLPLHNLLTSEDVGYVTSTLRSICNV